MQIDATHELVVQSYHMWLWNVDVLLFCLRKSFYRLDGFYSAEIGSEAHVGIVFPFQGKDLSIRIKRPVMGSLDDLVMGSKAHF